MAPRPIILYDGLCMLCSRLVPFVLERDQAALLRVATLQSAFAQQALMRHGEEPGCLDTLYVLLDPGLPSERLLAGAQAVLYVLRRLKGPWRFASLLGFLPPRLLDLAYNLVARNRYRLFGRSAACVPPRPEWRDRFVEV
jgi:predicted DCC family thiol-disulfide oxidoreductase YuxK